jgi:methionyl-tRNA formyltransferase
VQVYPQSLLISDDDLKQAPKIFKETCNINWNQPTETVYNLIRGLSPSPTAYTELAGKTLKIFKAEQQTMHPAIQPGGFLTDNKTYLKFAAKDGFISVTDLQLEGKKRMGIEEFLRGNKL